MLLALVTTLVEASPSLVLDPPGYFGHRGKTMQAEILFVALFHCFFDVSGRVMGGTFGLVGLAFRFCDFLSYVTLPAVALMAPFAFSAVPLTCSRSILGTLRFV